MHASTEPLDILSVTTSEVASEHVGRATDDRWRVTHEVWTERGEENGHEGDEHENVREPPDIVLVAETEDREGATAIVRRVRRNYPETPIIAFVGKSQGVDRLFEAGATDVVQSAVTETTPSLVRRRLGSVLAVAERPSSESGDDGPESERLYAAIDQTTQEFHEALLSAETPEQVLQATCDSLTTAERYRAAVAFQCTEEDHLEATVWTAGAEEFVTNHPHRPEPATIPARRALESKETQVRQVEPQRATESGTVQASGDQLTYAATVPVVYEGVEYGVLVVFSSRKGRFDTRRLAVLDDLGATVGHALAAVERRERERTLTALYRATEAFLAAGTPEAISDVAVETAMEVLDLSGIGIFLFDDQTNLLTPVAGTETFLEFFGESPVFGPGKEDSITWHTYVTGETQCFADVRTSNRLAKPDTSARASLLIPLGEHGVFVAASRESGVFTEQKQQLVGLLAATTEAALDRVAGEADIRERDEVLERRTRQFECLKRLVAIGRDVMELVRQANTRRGLEGGLCERLVEYESLSFAWVGRYEPAEETLEPETWAGNEDGYLDAVSIEAGSDEPALEAMATGEPITVSNVTEHIHESDWAREAIQRGFQSVLAVPLRHGGTDYGVAVVYSTEQGAFDSSTEIVSEFGSIVAYGINTIETRRGVLGEETTELDLRLAGTETLFNAVAAVVDASVRYREVVPIGDQTTEILFSVADPPVEEVLALESQFVGIDALRLVRPGERHLFRATVSGPAVASTILDCGGVPIDVTATSGETLATVRVPTDLTAREFVERLEEHYPAVELHTRREKPGDPTDNVRQAFEERLTDRQRDVLVSAYESGYFQSPRETTGVELADRLGIAQPTFTHHLREAQHRLLTALFDDES